jgi:periplasmic divalent cation tolerance protein
MSSSDGSNSVALLLVSVPTGGALALVRQLVEERWIACGSVLPGVHSIYRWQGAIEEAEESLLLLKAPRSRADDLRQRIVALHPYAVPEILELEVRGGHLPYLRWVIEEGSGECG